MERLLRSELFSRIPRERARALAQVGRFQVLREGGYLMREGDPSTFLALLLRGRLGVLSTGEEVVIAEIPVGAPVGELGLITRQPRRATVVAFEESEVWRLDDSDFEALLEAGDPRGGALLAELGRTLAARLRAQRLDGLAMIPGLAQDPRGVALLGELGWRCGDPLK